MPEKTVVNVKENLAEQNSRFGQIIKAQEEIK